MRPSNTIIREAILKALKDTDTPLDTAQIHLKTDIDADLVTIYRGLEYLQKQKLISSFSFNCSKSRIKKYYTYKGTGHRHFLHCESCHSFSPIAHCVVDENIKSIEKKYKCKINSHHLSYSGLCNSCC